MTYGLYDADLPYYPTPFYNLELMKISSYYKHKREIVGLSPDFSPSKYGKFIVRQDFYNPRTQFLNDSNIVYGGRAIDGNKYKPLPIEIEQMQPDFSIYERVKLPISKVKNKNALSSMRRAEHIRLSLDGKTIWKDFEKQFRHHKNCFGVIFHDYDLNQIDGAYELISNELPNWIHNNSGRRIGMKFTTQVDNKEDFCKWLSFKPFNIYFSLNHNGLITNDYIPEISESCHKVSSIAQVSMDISNEYTLEELISGGFQRIFRTIINLRSHRIVFSLIYNRNLFMDSEWGLVMDLIYKYNQHLISAYDTEFFRRVEPFETMYSYCKAAIKQPTVKDPIFKKDSIQSIFQFVREGNYELFKDFYEYRGEEVRK